MMRIRKIDRSEATAQFDDPDPAHNVIVAACDADLGVVAPNSEVPTSSDARKEPPEVCSQRILKITTDDHSSSVADLVWSLIPWLEAHPLVSAGLADYIYWPHPSDLSNFAVVLYSSCEVSFLLFPKEKYDWRKNMRILTDDDRPEWQINREVFAECADPYEVRHPQNERDVVLSGKMLKDSYTQSDLALKLALEALTVEHLIIN